MEKELKYKGHTITVKFPSGMFEYYSDKQGRFLKFDTLKAAKESITDESKKGKSVNESVKKITLSELKGIVRKLVMEQKSEYNEISDELFTKSVKTANEKGHSSQTKRLLDLGMRNLKRYDFGINGDTYIKDIHFKKDGGDDVLIIIVTTNSIYGTISYNIDKDNFDFDGDIHNKALGLFNEKGELLRKDANFLIRIARKFNPDTKYMVYTDFEKNIPNKKNVGLNSYLDIDKIKQNKFGKNDEISVKQFIENREEGFIKLVLSNNKKITYEADLDEFDLEGIEENGLIHRKDAFFLSKLAKKYNKETKYNTPTAFKLIDKY